MFLFLITLKDKWLSKEKIVAMHCMATIAQNVGGSNLKYIVWTFLNYISNFGNQINTKKVVINTPRMKIE